MSLVINYDYILFVDGEECGQYSNFKDAYDEIEHLKKYSEHIQNITVSKFDHEEFIYTAIEFELINGVWVLITQNEEI